MKTNKPSQLSLRESSCQKKKFTDLETNFLLILQIVFKTLETFFKNIKTFFLLLLNLFFKVC